MEPRALVAPLRTVERRDRDPAGQLVDHHVGREHVDNVDEHHGVDHDDQGHDDHDQHDVGHHHHNAAGDHDDDPATDHDDQLDHHDDPATDHDHQLHDDEHDQWESAVPGCADQRGVFREPLTAENAHGQPLASRFGGKTRR